MLGLQQYERPMRTHGAPLALMNRSWRPRPGLGADALRRFSGALP